GRSCPDGVAGPGWSPDGSRISFICHSGSTSSIRVLDLGSGSTAELTAVAAPESYVSPPRWSPDGRTIAFDILVTDPSSGDVLGGSLLALVPSAGGDVVRI